MKITHAKLSKSMGPGKRLVTICAELGNPNEYMTITVAVANDGGDDNVREIGLARARDFARQFGDMIAQNRKGRPTDSGS